MIVENFSETLSEISVDNFSFRITWNPIEAESCILWFKDHYASNRFEALGKFSSFDKRKSLEFIVKFCTNAEMRNCIEQRQFEKKLENLSLTYFEELDKMSYYQKKQAYRNLYNLDSGLSGDNIDKKRRIMASRFHPDVGGDHLSMSIINEAYEFLVTEEK